VRGEAKKYVRIDQSMRTYFFVRGVKSLAILSFLLADPDDLPADHQGQPAFMVRLRVEDEMRMISAPRAMNDDQRHKPGLFEK
jgi:hypothetical protein